MTVIFFFSPMSKRQRTFATVDKRNGVIVRKVDETICKEYCANCCERHLRGKTKDKRLTECQFLADNRPDLLDFASLPTLKSHTGRCSQCGSRLMVTLENEFHEYGDLQEYVKRNNSTITPKERLQFALETMRIAMGLICQNVVHGDIKPENIVVCEDSKGSLGVKFIDFDSAKQIDFIPYEHCRLPLSSQRLDDSKISPSQTIPSSPSHTIPSSPSQTIPSSPSQTIPSSPSQTIPSSPSQTIPSSPSQTIPSSQQALSLTQVSSLSQVNPYSQAHFTYIHLCDYFLNWRL